MRLISAAAALAIALPTAALAQDADRTVAGGGIMVEGWKGKVDARAAQSGKTVNDSKFAKNGDNLELKIGPAAIYWNDANVASGNYEVKATFTENAHRPNHPHSYGVFIGGSDLETDNQSFVYCIVYANGTYSAKYFHGSNVVTIADRVASDAINKADASGRATNEIGWRVKDGKASCVINGKEVQIWNASDLVAPDKLKSLEGKYGVRVSHNLDLTMTPLTLTKM
jgi:opacity protein-like surface antigen